MSQELKSLPPPWETPVQLQVPGFGLIRAWLLRHLRGEPMDGNTVYVYKTLKKNAVSNSNTICKFYILLGTRGNNVTHGGVLLSEPGSRNGSKLRIIAF